MSNPINDANAALLDLCLIVCRAVVAYDDTVEKSIELFNKTDDQTQIESERIAVLHDAMVDAAELVLASVES